jgi:nitrite reductase/ring-hydroxylating ferredoxin subunit
VSIDQHDVQGLVSVQTGEINRRIFTDEEIFEREMRQIFGRAWLFLCHESQMPNPGDFFEAPMGRDNVLVVRQKDGTLRALLNTCTHRGNSICRAEEGNARNFMCTYHGWTFDISGDLIGVPGMQKFYNDTLDRSKLGLRQVAHLDTYKGFVFATLDESAPPLHDFLGTAGRLGLDLIAELGDIEIVPGVQKFLIDANWKLTVDNVFDWYHPQITHMSAAAAKMLPEDAYDGLLETAVDGGGAQTPDGGQINFTRGYMEFIDSITVLGEYGHGISGPPTALDNPLLSWRKRPEVAAALGPVGMKVGGHPNIFPTMWITTFGQVSLRVPRTPTSTEVWWFSFVPKEMPPEARAHLIELQNHTFGAAGILEQDDGENWSQSTRQAFGAESSLIPHQLKMNLGRGHIIHEDGIARIESRTSEHGQFWMYLAWAQWMTGSSWDVLRQNTIPGELI